jgi:hypothetical protein
MPAEICLTPHQKRSRLQTEQGREKEMKSFNVATSVCCLAVMGAVFAPSAKADDWNRKTVIRFNAPVEIPGVHLAGWGVLPAGTYVFKIMDSLSNRHIVQISNEDETTVYATILAIPNYRLKATDKTVMTFRERAAGEPEALRAWFYPGRNWGEEFVYPKAKAVELARATNLPVLQMPAPAREEAAKPEEARAELEQAPVTAVRPSGEEVEIAQVVTPPPPAEVAQVAAAPAPAAEPKLPTTASPLPLIALLGLLALGGALTLRVVEKRSL